MDRALRSYLIRGMSYADTLLASVVASLTLLQFHFPSFSLLLSYLLFLHRFLSSYLLSSPLLNLLSYFFPSSSPFYIFSFPPLRHPLHLSFLPHFHPFHSASFHLPNPISRPSSCFTPFYLPSSSFAPFSLSSSSFTPFPFPPPPSPPQFSSAVRGRLE